MDKTQYIYENRKKIFDDFFQKKWKREEKLNVVELENGYVLPPRGKGYEKWQVGLAKPTMGNGGVVDAEGRFIDYSACRVEHLIKESALTRDRFGGKYDFERNEVIYRNETVIYCGIFWKQWGHFLIDQITRLWYVINNTEQKCKLVWVVGQDSKNPISGNYQQLLELLGIDMDRMEFVSQVTQFKRVIVPEPANYSGRYYTKEYNQMIEKIIQSSLQKYKGEVYEKIYFSRVKFSKHSSMEIGESNIEAIFKENGYKVLYPEELDVITQVALVNTCEKLASLEGTIAHNSLFMTEGKQQIVINRNRIINPFQFQINEMRKVRTVFVDAWSEPIEPISLKNTPGSFWKDPSFVSVNELLKKYFNDYNMQISKKADNSFIYIKNRIKLSKKYFEILYLKKWKKRIKKLIRR